MRTSLYRHSPSLSAQPSLERNSTARMLRRLAPSSLTVVAAIFAPDTVVIFVGILFSLVCLLCDKRVASAADRTLGDRNQRGSPHVAFWQASVGRPVPSADRLGVRRHRVTNGWSERLGR